MLTILNVGIERYFLYEEFPCEKQGAVTRFGLMGDQTQLFKP